jgi:hypothetical protein
MRTAISPELKDALKRLRLDPLLDTLPDRIAIAEKQDLPLQDFLLLILTDEITRRQTSASRRRAQDAGLDPDMVFERWDKTAKVHYDRRVLAELATLRFIEGHRKVIVLRGGDHLVERDGRHHALRRPPLRAGVIRLTDRAHWPEPFT